MTELSYAKQGVVNKLQSFKVWHNADGQRSGITPESLKNAAAVSKQMNLEEAYKILGTDSNAGIEEVMKVKAICFLSCLYVCCQRSSNMLQGTM